MASWVEDPEAFVEPVEVERDVDIEPGGADWGVDPYITTADDEYWSFAKEAT